jgi:hypothetical protein
MTALSSYSALASSVIMLQGAFFIIILAVITLSVFMLGVMESLYTHLNTP